MLPQHMHAAAKEYIVEIVVFKNLNDDTSEIFKSQVIDLEEFKLQLLGDQPEVELIIKEEILLLESEARLASIPIVEDILESKIIESMDALPVIESTEHWFIKRSGLDQLDNIHRRLERRQEYKVLHHTSWVQPAQSQEDAAYVHEEFGDSGFLLQLYQSRYLHLDLRNYLDKLSNVDAANPSILSDQLAEDQNKFQTEYLLSETRRIFVNESHFFDHPKMGVIVSVYDSSL